MPSTLQNHFSRPHEHAQAKTTTEGKAGFYRGVGLPELGPVAGDALEGVDAPELLLVRGRLLHAHH